MSVSNRKETPATKKKNIFKGFQCIVNYKMDSGYVKKTFPVQLACIFTVNCASYHACANGILFLTSVFKTKQSQQEKNSL